MWVKTHDGDYVNLSLAGWLHAGEPGDPPDVWSIYVYIGSANTTSPGVNIIRLSGDYDSQAEAQEAIRHLVHGIDSSV